MIRFQKPDKKHKGAHNLRDEKERGHRPDERFVKGKSTKPAPKRQGKGKH